MAASVPPTGCHGSFSVWYGNHGDRSYVSAYLLGESFDFRKKPTQAADELEILRQKVQREEVGGVGGSVRVCVFVVCERKHSCVCLSGE